LNIKEEYEFKRLFELVVTNIFMIEKTLWQKPIALPTSPIAVPMSFSSTKYAMQGSRIEWKTAQLKLIIKKNKMIAT
jgi:hypothetical protein